MTLESLSEDQHSVEIFCCYLHLLSSCSSIHHQTNIENTQICSEDHPSVSRIRLLHLLLDALAVNDEEDTPLSSILQDYHVEEE